MSSYETRQRSRTATHISQTMWLSVKDWATPGHDNGIEGGSRSRFQTTGPRKSLSSRRSGYTGSEKAIWAAGWPPIKGTW